LFASIRALTYQRFLTTLNGTKCAGFQRGNAVSALLQLAKFLLGTLLVFAMMILLMMMMMIVMMIISQLETATNKSFL